MLLALNKITGLPRYAWEATKDHDWVCRGCKDDVILRKGMVMVHHYSHRAGSTCCFGKIDTVDHMNAKKTLVSSFDGFTVEEQIGEDIIDLYNPDEKIAITFKSKNYSPKKLNMESELHYENGIHHLFLPLATMEQLKVKMELPQHKKVPTMYRWLNTMSFNKGICVFCIDDQKIYYLTFNNHKTVITNMFQLEPKDICFEIVERKAFNDMPKMTFPKMKRKPNE